MKKNYDENQILLSIHLNLIPENSDFKVDFNLIQKVARLKIKDFNLWNNISPGNKKGLWKQYCRIAAINLLKYKDECGYNKDFNESFIYILTDKQFKNHYKIGRTIEPERRLSECNVYSPYKSFNLISWTFSSNAIEDEKFFHEKFIEDRLEGEWFYFNEVENIRKYITRKLYVNNPPPLKYTDYL